MYNRYIPNNAQYQPIHEGQRNPFRPPKNTQRPPPPPRKGANPLDGLAGGLGGLLNRFHLERLDSGDLLLVLILIFLLLERDDNTELVIALGLLLLFGLFEEDESGDAQDSSSPTA